MCHDGVEVAASVNDTKGCWRSQPLSRPRSLAVRIFCKVVSPRFKFAMNIMKTANKCRSMVAQLPLSYLWPRDLL